MAATLEELAAAAAEPVATETMELLPGMEVVIRPITSFAVLAGIERTARDKRALLAAKPLLIDGENVRVTQEMAQAAVMLSEAVIEPELDWRTAVLLLNRYAVECGRVLARVNELMGTQAQGALNETEAALNANSFQDGDSECEPAISETASE